MDIFRIIAFGITVSLKKMSAKNMFRNKLMKLTRKGKNCLLLKHISDSFFYPLLLVQV